MKENVFDIATDVLKERMDNAFAMMHKQFKGTNPYRKEPVSPTEQLKKYYQLTPEMEMAMRQSMGDEAVDTYISRMEQLRQRYGK